MYKINNLDALATYGIEFLPGTYDQLLQSPKRKPTLVQEWANENGTERYLGSTFYETITYSLPIIMVASSDTQFWTRYNAFVNFLLTSGLFNLDAVNINRRFRVSYADITQVDTLTKIKGSKNIGMKMTLQLFNDYPTEVLPIP